MSPQMFVSELEGRFQQDAQREERVVAVFGTLDRTAWAAHPNRDVVQNKGPSLYRQGLRSH